MATFGEIMNRKFTQVSKSQTLSGSSATVSTPLFQIIGSVKVHQLYAVVTTALGSNVTAAFWRLNDQTAQVAISLATGTTVSAAPAGSVLARGSLVSVALTLKSSVAGAVLDPVAATAPDVFMPFALVQKAAGIETDIEFTYTTSNAPTSGVLTHFVEYEALSVDGAVNPL